MSILPGHKEYSLSQIGILKRFFAFITLGNLHYEKGDMIFNYSFAHAFSSEDEIRSELEEGGFNTISGRLTMTIT